jgi:DNA modification methylase
MYRTEKRKVEEIVLNSKNPRTIRDEKFKKLVKSIKDFPEMLEVRPIVVDDDMIVLGGNMRLKACIEAGLKEVPIIKFSSLSEEKKKEFIVKDNVGYGDWDFDFLLEEWEKTDLLDWGLDIKKGHRFEEEIKLRLADRFGVPPFTILDTRQGDWQKRKKDWKVLINDNGESRQNTLAQGDQEKSIYQNMNGGVSLLDPVVSEIICNWFAPEKSKILDPFAGDTVFGYVSSFLGHEFTGIEIREEQARLNNERTGEKAKYICDDGQNVLKWVKEGSQDLIFSCPPYYDLEEYSKLENDASNQETYEDFIKILDNAFTDSIKCLKENRFAVVIVGDLRDESGFYYNFHEDIKFIFNKNGMRLYNELILIEPVGLNAMRANKLMENRKVPKVHQNVLVFFKSKNLEELESVYRKVFVFHKGDPKEIRNDFKSYDYRKVKKESEKKDEGTDV